MNINFSNTAFYTALESSLVASNAEKRKMWAAAIIENNISIKDLSGLLQCEKKIATRFLWLLSEIGILNPDKLLAELPFLLDLCDRLNPIYKQSFAIFWLIAGVPPENEGIATDLLFQWLLSTDTNVTTKSRSFVVLSQLAEKYPELKNELKLCLKDQMDKHSKDFEKRVAKILAAIGTD